jgi:hypothetical protein
MKKTNLLKISRYKNRKNIKYHYFKTGLPTTETQKALLQLQFNQSNLLKACQKIIFHQVAVKKNY